MAYTPLTAGEMDQVLTLFAPTLVKDEFGQHTEYAEVTRVAAKVKPLTGTAFFSAGAMQTPASLMASIYYRRDVLGSWRLTWMGKWYELVADPIDVEAAHQRLDMMCKGVAL